jgi:hypothetical protein
MFSKLAEAQLGAVKREFFIGILICIVEVCMRQTFAALRDALIVYFLFIVLEGAKK